MGVREGTVELGEGTLALVRDGHTVYTRSSHFDEKRLRKDAERLGKDHGLPGDVVLARQFKRNSTSPFYRLDAYMKVNTIALEVR